MKRPRCSQLCARPGCGKRTKRDRNKYCSARCNAAHHHDLYCSASLPVKKWYGNCRVCGEDLPIFMGESYSTKNAPRGCRAIFNPHCCKEVKKMGAFDAAQRRQGKTRPQVHGNCARCGKDFEGMPGQIYCGADCRIENQYKRKRSTYVFNRSECCKRADENGWLVNCANYVDSLETDFKQCPQHDCFVWPAGRKAA